MTSCCRASSQSRPYAWTAKTLHPHSNHRCVRLDRRDAASSFKPQVCCSAVRFGFTRTHTPCVSCSHKQTCIHLMTHPPTPPPPHTHAPLPHIRIHAPNAPPSPPHHHSTHPLTPPPPTHTHTLTAPHPHPHGFTQCTPSLPATHMHSMHHSPPHTHHTRMHACTHARTHALNAPPPQSRTHALRPTRTHSVDQSLLCAGAVSSVSLTCRPSSPPPHTALTHLCVCLCRSCARSCVPPTCRPPRPWPSWHSCTAQCPPCPGSSTPGPRPSNWSWAGPSACCAGTRSSSPAPLPTAATAAAAAGVSDPSTHP